jgi:hypothetical protein
MRKRIASLLVVALLGMGIFSLSVATNVPSAAPAQAAALSCSHPAQGLHSYGVPNYKHAIYLTAYPDVIAHVYKFVAGSWKFQGSVRINCD